MSDKTTPKDINSIVEEWLASVPERQCFTERMKVYAPTCYGKCEGEVNALVEKLNRLFKGSTTYDACTGCWFDAEINKVECEPVRIIELAHNCGDKKELQQLMDAIIDYAVKADQKSMSIMNGHFYITKKPSLIERYGEETA